MKNAAKIKQNNLVEKKSFNKNTVIAVICLTVFGGFFLFLWLKPEDQANVTQENGKSIMKPEERIKKNILLGPHIPPETKSLYFYSQRLEDTNNLMWTLLVTVMHETMKTGKQPADLPTLIELAKKRTFNGNSMWMDRWLISPDKQAVKTDVGYNLLAYRANPLSIEIRNVPFEQGTQVILMRVPEVEGSPLVRNPDFAEPRKMVAGMLLLISPTSGAFYPPFTPKDTYLMSNWREEPIKLSLNNSPEREAIIRRWVDEAAKGN